MYCVVDSVVALPPERKSLVSLYRTITEEVSFGGRSRPVLASAIWDFVALISGCERWLGHPNYVAGKFAALTEQMLDQQILEGRLSFKSPQESGGRTGGVLTYFHPKWT